MQTLYQTWELTVPANSEVLTEALVATVGALPEIASIGRTATSNTSFLFYVNDSLVAEIPAELDIGFGSFFPLYYGLKDNDVTRGGFRNKTAGPLTLLFTIQYSYPVK